MKLFSDEDHGIDRKERKDIRRGRKRTYLCGLCAIPRRPQRLLDHKLNLFSEKTTLLML